MERDPANLDRGWGWIEVDDEVVKAYDISTVSPTAHVAADGRRVCLPSRGRARAKKFELRIGNEQVTIRAQKFLTVKALCAWAQTWAPENTQVISPGGYPYTLHGESLSSSKAHCVYFILNRDSNAIKIGRAKNIQRRLKSLQTASPIELELLKTINLNSEGQAKGLEGSLHALFWYLRMQGEWFRAEPELLNYIETGNLPNKTHR